jgi:hypothetical protein
VHRRANGGYSRPALLTATCKGGGQSCARRTVRDTIEDMRWLRPRRPDGAGKTEPAAEADRMFSLLESTRRAAFYSQQILGLVGRSPSEPTCTPDQNTLVELRYRLRQFLAGPAVAGPADAWGWSNGLYEGVELLDPFVDERPRSLADVPAFTPVQLTHQRFVAYEGFLLDRQTDEWREAPGFDQWLLAILHTNVPDVLGRLTKDERKRLLPQ